MAFVRPAKSAAAKTALATGAVAAQVAAGGVAASSPSLVMAGALTMLGAVLLIAAPAVILLGALPSSIGYWRVGPESFSLSLADVTLAMAFLAALPFVPWNEPRLRNYGRLLAGYLLLLGIPVVATLSRRTVLEWGHRGFLIGCALVLGAAMQRLGLTRWALRLYVATAAVVAIAAVFDTAGQSQINGLSAPAYPFGMQKNPAALLLAFAVLVLVVAPRLVALTRPVRATALVVLFAGMLACQSRGAAIALVLVLLVWLARTGRVIGSPLVGLGLVVLVAMTLLSFDALFSSEDADSRFNPVNSRIETFEAAIDVWQDEPIAGAGLKYWRDTSLARAAGQSFDEPHNLVIAALGESGIIGLAALVLLVVGASRLVGREKDELALLAGAVLWAKIVASGFDIFWVAGTMTVPWVIIGMHCASTRDAQGEPTRSRPSMLTHR